MRAQEMVFEVLVGAILLAIVIALSKFVLDRLTTGTCKYEIASQLAKFRLALEQVAEGDEGSKKSLTLDFPECMGISQHQIAIDRMAEKEICRLVCREDTPVCMIVKYQGLGQMRGTLATIFSTKYCLHIPAATTLTSDCPEEPPPGYTWQPLSLGSWFDVSYPTLFVIYRPGGGYRLSVCAAVREGRR